MALIVTMDGIDSSNGMANLLQLLEVVFSDALFVVKQMYHMLKCLGMYVLRRMLHQCLPVIVRNRMSSSLNAQMEGSAPACRRTWLRITGLEKVR